MRREERAYVCPPQPPFLVEKAPAATPDLNTKPQRRSSSMGPTERTSYKYAFAVLQSGATWDDPDALGAVAHSLDMSQGSTHAHASLAKFWLLAIKNAGLRAGGAEPQLPAKSEPKPEPVESNTELLDTVTKLRAELAELRKELEPTREQVAEIADALG